MPNPWDRLLSPKDAYSDLQRSLAGQYDSSLFQFTPVESGYTISTFGEKGPRHLRTDFDPITQRFYSAGAGFHPSWMGGVETGPVEALSAFVGGLIQGSTDPMPKLQDPYSYQRSQFGGEYWTGGPPTPEWASWQRAQHFMGAEPLDPSHSTPWSYLRRRAEFPESYPTVSGLTRQASGFQYGPLLTHASAFEAQVGMGMRGEGVDTSIISSYGGHKPREKLGLEDPGRLFNIYGETLHPSSITGTQETYDPSGGAIRRTGVQRNVEFAPGFLFPGAGQSYGLASAFRQTELGQGKTFTTPLSYDQMTNWAMKTGRPVMEVAGYMYDRAQRPNVDFADIMGFGVGMNPQARRGTSQYIPRSATLNLPYGPQLGALVQEYAEDILPQWRGSEIAGFGTEILQQYPKTAEEQYAYTSWLNVLDAEGGLRRKIAAGGEVEFFPGEQGARPFVTTGYEQLSPWTSGHALQAQGVKSVMTMYQDLQAMGAESQTEILLGGESVKGSSFMAESLVNALGATQMMQLGVPASAFEGGVLRGGAQPEVISAMRGMLTDPAIRPRFEQALETAGGSIQTKWMQPPVDPSWLEMMQPGGAFAAQVVQEKQGAPVGSFYLGGGTFEQKIETMMLPSIVAPTESPQRGNLGGFNFNDLIAMAQNNPEVAGAIYGRARETAAPYASLIMAASGLLPPDAQTTQTVGEGGIVLPVERARALAAQELQGSPLAAMYGPSGTEQPPLKFMLQAMAAEGSPFRGKFMPIESDLSQTAYLPPAEDLLKTQTFTAFGGPVSALGFKMQGMLNRISSGTEGATPEISAYTGALTELARQQGIVKGAFMGETEPSMSGRLQYVGGVETGGKPGVVVPDPEYGRIMESLGAEGTNEQAMAAFLRWPDAGEHAIFGQLMSASQAAKAQRAAGVPPIDPGMFRGIGFTGRSAELIQETYTDVDKDVGTVVAELVSRVPGLEVAGELRTKFITTMENVYPEAIPAATKALAGVMGVSPSRVTPDMLSAGAILSYAGGGKARESIQPALDFGTLSNWAEEKMIEPRDIGVRELGEVRTAEALGSGSMIGLASNFSDAMRFYMSEYAGGLEGREAEVYRGEAHRATQQLLHSTKQTLVDTSGLPSVSGVGGPFASLSQAGQGLFGPMTAEMWRRKGAQAGGITQAVVGEYEERGGRIFPARASIQESELLTGFAAAAMKQGMDVRGVAALLGGQERMEQEAPGMFGYLLQSQSEDPQTRAEAIFPFEAGQATEFREYFRKTPIGAMIYGQGAYRAGRRVLDIESRLAERKEIAPWEEEFLAQARPDLESGHWDPEVDLFLRAQATTGVGGRARMLREEGARYNPRGRITSLQLSESVAAQVASGQGVTSDILAQTHLGQVGEPGVPFSQFMRDNPPPTIRQAIGDPTPVPGDPRVSVPRDREQIGAETGIMTPRERASNDVMAAEIAAQEASAGGTGGQPPTRPPVAVGGQFMGDDPSAGRGRPSRAQAAQDLTDPMFSQPAYQQRQAANAFGAPGVSWSDASRVLKPVFAGIPVSPQQEKAWLGAMGQEFLTTPELHEIQGMVTEGVPTEARYKVLEKTLGKLGTRFRQPGAQEIRPFAMDFLEQLRERAREGGWGGGAPAAELRPDLQAAMERSQESSTRFAARGFERLTGEDLGAMTAEIKEVTESLAKMSTQTKEAQEIIGKWGQVDTAMGKFVSLQAIAPEDRGPGWRNEAARAYSAAVGGMEGLMQAGLPGGPGGGEPPDEFGEGLGGQFRRAGAALRERVTGGQRIMTFFDLMYLQRLSTAMVQPMRQEAMRAEGMDIQTTGLMNQMGIGGPAQGMGPMGAVEGRMADAQLARGRAYGAAWGGRSVMPGIVEATAPLQAIGGPALQTFLQASFINEKMLGGAFPRLPGYLGLATAGLGALGYAESMYQQKEATGIVAARTVDWLNQGMKPRWDPGGGIQAFRGIVEVGMGAAVAGWHGENMGEWMAESTQTGRDVLDVVNNQGLSREAMRGLTPIGRNLAMNEFSRRMGKRLGVGEEQAFGMMSGGLFQAFGGQAINENIMAQMMRYGAGGMDPMAGQALRQAQTGELFDPRAGQGIEQYTLFAGANPVLAQRFQQYAPAVNQFSRTFGTGQEITPWTFQGTMGGWGQREAYWSSQVQGDVASMVASGAVSEEQAQAMVTQEMQMSGLAGDTMTGARRFTPQQTRQISRRAQAVNQLMAGPGGQQDINVMQTYMEFGGMLGNVGGQQMAVTQQGMTFQQQFAAGNRVARSAAYGPYDFRSTWDVQTHAPIFERAPTGLGLTGGDVLGMAGVDAGGVVGGGFMAGGVIGAQRALRTRGFEMQRARLGLSQEQLASQLPYQESVWDVQDRMTALSRGYQDFQWEMGGRRMDLQTQQFGQNQAFAQMQAGVQAGWGRQDIGTAVGRTGQQRQWMREDWAVQDSLRATQWGWQQQDFQENIRFATGRQRRLGIRAQQRGTVMHQAEEEQIERDRERQEQREAWQDEDFEKQRTRHEQRVEWQNERFELNRQHFDDNMELNRETHEEQREFTLEMRELEDELRDIQREHWKEQHEFAKQGLALQAEQINNQEDMFKLNNQIQDVLDLQKGLVAEYEAGVLSADRAQELLNEKIEEMKNLVDDVGVPGGGGDGGGGGWEPPGDGPIPIQFGGPVFPSQRENAYLVGDGGVPEIFIPDSAGRVSPFSQGDSLVQEFFSGISDLSNVSNALVVVDAIKDLVETLDRTNPDKAREVDNLLRIVAS